MLCLVSNRMHFDANEINKIVHNTLRRPNFLWVYKCVYVCHLTHPRGQLLSPLPPLLSYHSFLTSATYFFLVKLILSSPSTVYTVQRSLQGNAPNSVPFPIPIPIPIHTVYWANHMINFLLFCWPPLLFVSIRKLRKWRSLRKKY